MLSEALHQLSPKQRAALELRLEQLRRSRPGNAGMDCAAASGPVPLSFPQQRLWFVDQLEHGSSFYNVPAAVRLRGPLLPAELRRALDEVVGRHEALRTVFREHEGQAVQLVQAPQGPAELPLVDLQGLAAEAAAREARRLVVEEAKRSFDLARGPLLRCRLLRLAEREHIVVCVMHHIVSDWWSLGVLFRELTTAYRAFAAGVPPRLPALSSQYRDFALAQHQMRGEALEAQCAYWRRQLAGAPAFLNLPTDRPRPAVQTFRGAQSLLSLPPDLGIALEALSLAESCTLFITLLAAYQIFLHHRSGQSDFVVSAPIGLRDRKESEPLIGFFVNTLLFRADLSQDPTVREVLARVKTVVLEARAHQHLPLEQIIEEAAPERSLRYSPLLQASLNFVDGWDLDPGIPGQEAEELEIDSEESQFELNFVVKRTPRGLDGRLQYRTDLFLASTMRTCGEQLRQILDWMVAKPEAHLAEIRRQLDHEKERRRRSEKSNLEQSSRDRFRERRRKAVCFT
jgi:hypothetical protein